MEPVALDADLIIAFLDPGDDQHDRAVAELRGSLDAGARFLVAASVYAEVSVRPLQLGGNESIDGFLDAIDAEVVAIDRTLARRAAALRARHRALRLPDALSLTTALAHRAELLTFDCRLRRTFAQERRAAAGSPPA